MIKTIFALTGLLAGMAVAQDSATSFDTPDALKGWQSKGPVSLDTTKNHGTGTGGSLQLAPGAKSVWPLRVANGGGKAEFWVYDDLRAPDDVKAKRQGPQWGLIQSDGRILVAGVLYARYLGGNNSYAIADSDGKSWNSVQYSALKRLEGWHKWSFDFDPAKGLSIALDDKPARFDWSQTQAKGFTGLVFLGDSGADKPQTLWVDDIKVSLAGPVAAQAVATPARASVVPEKDPPATRKISFLPSVVGKHPRLLFTAEQIPAMRQFAQSEAGKPFMAKLTRVWKAAIPPDNTKFAVDATEAQRQGLWRLPTVALHYVLMGDQESLTRAKGFMMKFLETENWETTSEFDSGMAAANIMVGAALSYDWLYDQLDPDFREAFRKKLLSHARRMYYGGHLMKVDSTHYWQNDPQNNHRWHHDAGLALCVLAATQSPEDDWLLQKTVEEVQFVHDWLADDGSSHESPGYMTFGGPYLVMAFDSMDRCLGMNLMASSKFLANAPKFRLSTITPGFKDAFYFSDDEGFGFYTDYLYKCAAVNREADYQAAVFKFDEVQPDAFYYSWFSLIWFDPSLKGGSLENVPKTEFFPDNGLFVARDGWAENDVAMMFRCSPFGGQKLNQFRNERNFQYVNVGHDDPAANMFVLYANGALLADDDRYSKTKLTSSHNAILVNGKGQKGEGSAWTQPLKGADSDMTKTARIVSQKITPEIAFVEGEAGNAYEGLDRYRRSVLWVKGSYILVLDDIVAPAETPITWLMQGKQVDTVEPGHFRLTNGTAACDFRVATDQKYEAAIGESTADNRGKLLGYRQLQLTAKTKTWRQATLFDPWGGGKTQINFESAGNKITVQGPNFSDTWTWYRPATNQEPTVLVGSRKGGFSFSTGQ